MIALKKPVCVGSSGHEQLLEVLSCQSVGLGKFLICKGTDHLKSLRFEEFGIGCEVLDGGKDVRKEALVALVVAEKLEAKGLH